MIEIELERELDGRWIAEARRITPVGIAYGATREEAKANALAALKAGELASKDAGEAKP